MPKLSSYVEQKPVVGGCHGALHSMAAAAAQPSSGISTGLGVSGSTAGGNTTSGSAHASAAVFPAAPTIAANSNQQQLPHKQQQDRCSLRFVPADQDHQQPQPPQQQGGGSSGSGSGSGSGGNQQGPLNPQHEAAINKLQADYSKRMRDHGPRTFRWPDGSLRPERPPPNPHAVASRRQWAELVQHCRMHGGDRGYERHGFSLRHGLGVEHWQHEVYLRSIGLEPETTASGEHRGEVRGCPGPLEDPEHCFHTYYREGAEAVFKDARGRLL